MPDHDPLTRRDAGSGEKPSAGPLAWSQVLDEEDRTLLGTDEGDYGAPAGSASTQDEAARLKEVVARLHRRGRTALCLSGGGVRSGTFALGILQAMAQRNQEISAT